MGRRSGVSCLLANGERDQFEPSSVCALLQRDAVRSARRHAEGVPSALAAAGARGVLRLVALEGRHD